MIILEVTDETGKLINTKFLASLGYNIHHLKYDEKNYEGFMNFAKWNSNKLVLDRGFITEIVYGPIVRTGSRNNEIETKK